VGNQEKQRDYAKNAEEALAGYTDAFTGNVYGDGAFFD
jgi:hypothetical protein